MNNLTTNAHRLVRLFERMRHGKTDPAFQRMTDLGLSFSHLRAMHILVADHALSMKEIADALGFTPPSVTALTRRLVQTGMVRRETDTNDSRVSLLSLTDDGRSLLRDMYQQRIRGMEHLLQGLSAEEQELFLDLLERAVAAMSEQDDQVTR